MLLSLPLCNAPHYSPVILWDSLGFGKNPSGIKTHMDCLLKELRLQGVYPQMIRSSDKRYLQPFISGVQQFFYPSNISKKKWIFHGFANCNLPLIRNKHGLYVLTVHDVCFAKSPRIVSTSYQWQMKFFFPQSLKVAHKIICVSQKTKKDLLNLYPEYENKYVVIENGIEQQSDPFSCFRNASWNASGDASSILFVSRLESYKGFDLLCELINRGSKKITWDLVVCEKGKNFLKKHIKDFSNIRILTNIDHQALLDLYKKNSVFLQTSSYEGFGIPGFDGLAKNLSVVCYKETPLGEKKSRQIFTVEDYWNIAQWQDALKNAFLRFENSLSNEYFLEDLKLLTTWQKSAKDLALLYNELYAL